MAYVVRILKTATMVGAAGMFTLCLLASLAESQTFSVLHSFGEGSDGYEPLSGVTIDVVDNLYGTAMFGGGNSSGIAYKLTRHGSDWTYAVLHHFGGPEGSDPQAKLLLDNNGSLYGTATAGGTWSGGTLFNLRPSPNRCGALQCPWSAAVLHNFAQSSDGASPESINFDFAGNIIGTTPQGGPVNLGTVFRLTRSQGGWEFSVLTGFRGTATGADFGGVVADAEGNVFGAGSSPYPGTVFEITNAGEVEILHRFTSRDGLDPFYGLVMDPAGNLYGQTAFGGPQSNGGTVYELSPNGGSWIFSTAYSFPGAVNDGVIGSASVTMDVHGNIYGTTFANGAYNYGTVFKLTPSENGWIYTDLHDFTGGTDGCYPWSDVVMDSSGNLYGTASGCGASRYPTEGGTVWEITP